MDQQCREVLTSFVPPAAVPLLETLLPARGLKLVFTRNRSSKLGDYKMPVPDRPYHQITVNSGLNPELTLLVLLHELAHMRVLLRNGRTRNPHGPQWKKEYIALLQPFLKPDIFEAQTLALLTGLIANGGIRSRFSPGVMSVINRNNVSNGAVYVKDIPEDGFFIFRNRQSYQRLERVRTRFRCLNLLNGRIYLFSAMAEVWPASLPEGVQVGRIKE